MVGESAIKISIGKYLPEPQYGKFSLTWRYLHILYLNLISVYIKERYHWSRLKSKWLMWMLTFGTWCWLIYFVILKRVGKSEEWVSSFFHRNMEVCRTHLSGEIPLSFLLQARKYLYQLLEIRETMKR